MRKLLAVLLVSLGCATQHQAQVLEKKTAELDEHVTRLVAAAAVDSKQFVALDEYVAARLAAIERREEYLLVAIARLEKFQRHVEAREAEAAKKAGTPPPPPPPAPLPVPRTDPSPVAPGYYSKDGSYYDDFKRAQTEDFKAAFLTGKPAAGFVGDDASAPGGPKPFLPRDPGEKGLTADGSGAGLLGAPLSRTRFLAWTGETVDLKEHAGKKNVVLVVLRGWAGNVCTGCSAQTAALAETREQFAQKDAQIYVVYPGKPSDVAKFLDAVRDVQGNEASLPLDLLLDIDLAVVKEFNISGRLAKPTTVILDKQGIVRFAHVGQSRTDRPSIPQLLAVLTKLQSEGK